MSHASNPIAALRTKGPARWYVGLRPLELEMDQDVFIELARG